MKLQIQNVTFFLKNREFQIARGSRSIIWGVITKGGLVLVKLKGYDRYYFDPKTWKVFSKVSGEVYRPLRQHTQSVGGSPFYLLYHHGSYKRIYLDQILKENMSGIEIFLKEDPSTSSELKLVS